MPAAAASLNGGELAASSSSGDYLKYEQPPGPDRVWSVRENAYLPSKRRSWMDVVDQCSEQHTERTSTITDISSLADSRTSVPTAQYDVLTLPNPGRRRSWEQLIEENGDNGAPLEHSVDIEFVKPAPPLPTLPLPYANPSLHMLTVRDDGRLARVHLYNKKRNSADSSGRTADLGLALKGEGNRKESSSASSKTSTMSEFILVPSKTALTSSSSSITESDSRRFRYEFGKAKGSPIGFLCPWPLSRRAVLVTVLTAVLLLASGLGGYLLRRFIIGRRTIYELTYPTSQEYEVRGQDSSDQSPTTLRLVVNEPSSAEFLLKGTFPYQDVRTVVDFDKKLVISRHRSDLKNHCFVYHLNESAFPTIDALQEAAENALSKKRAVSWPEDWRWQLELVNENLRDQLYFDSESRANCGQNLYWLQRIDWGSFAAKCVECRPVCLPSYGVTRLGLDYGRALLAPIGRDCFWMSSSSTAAPSPSPLSQIARPFVNNRYNNGDSYLNGPTYGASTFNQQRPPVDTNPFRQPPQNRIVPYANRQAYPNVYFNPGWPYSNGFRN